MRVPIPVVILLAAAVVGGVWWRNTRHMDFLTPPSEARLREIRIKTESSFPRADRLDDATSEPVLVKRPEPPPAPEPPPPPPVDPGDLSVPASLDQYADRGAQGAAELIRLSKALEEKGEFQRSLLAWERVLDHTHPEAAQSAEAVTSIRRLRPTLPDWNTKPEGAIQVNLRASTGSKLSKPLGKVLDSLAKELETGSSGILRVRTQITVGKTSSRAKGPAPVAVWMTGNGKKPVSTEVVSFTTEDAEPLAGEVSKAVFQLLRSSEIKAGLRTPPEALAADESTADALAHRVTRLAWSEFGRSLSPPAKKSP